MARKETEEKYQDLEPWRHSRTQRRANYRAQLVARCHYRVSKKSYGVCIYLTVHLKVHILPREVMLEGVV